MWRLRKSASDEALRMRLLGFIRSRDRLRIDELAILTGRPALEADALLAELVAEGALDMVFHRSTNEYVHRARIDRDVRVVSRCPSCGASFRAELILEGEKLYCQYCNSVL
jgi:DNA-directed RNA polymerase subunit RPC12/RpoP